MRKHAMNEQVQTASEGLVSKDREDLRARTLRFSLRILRVAQAASRSGIGRVLGHQLLRSGTNPGAMYREAHRARSDAEFITKTEIALQELDETDSWLELLGASRLVAAPRLAPLRQECDGLISTFTTIVRKRKRRT
jgi:four helix bundle protein